MKIFVLLSRVPYPLEKGDKLRAFNQIKELAKKILANPKEISLEMSKPAEGVLQAVYLTYDTQKSDLIHSLLTDKPEYESILIFSSTKKKGF